MSLWWFQGILLILDGRDDSCEKICWTRIRIHDHCHEHVIALPTAKLLYQLYCQAIRNKFETILKRYFNDYEIIYNDYATTFGDF